MLLTFLTCFSTVAYKRVSYKKTYSRIINVQQLVFLAFSFMCHASNFTAYATRLDGCPGTCACGAIHVTHMFA